MLMSICQGITMGSIVTHDLVSGGFFKKEPDGQTGLDPVWGFAKPYKKVELEKAQVLWALSPLG